MSINEKEIEDYKLLHYVQHGSPVAIGSVIENTYKTDWNQIMAVLERISEMSSHQLFMSQTEHAWKNPQGNTMFESDWSVGGTYDIEVIYNAILKWCRTFVKFSYEILVDGKAISPLAEYNLGTVFNQVKTLREYLETTGVITNSVNPRNHHVLYDYRNLVTSGNPVKIQIVQNVTYNF